MKPPPKVMKFERVKRYDDWIPGKIADIQYDEEHESSFKGEKKVGPCVRFKFALEDHEFPKQSRWLTFSYGEKANLYKNFLSALVDGAKPNMDFDLDDLKGFPIKTMWTADGEYDNLTLIRPLDKPYQIQVPF